MGTDIEIRGLEEALRKLRAMPENIKQFAARGLYLEAEAVMADSKENYVPVDTGTLRSTGHVRRPELTEDTITVELGYGGPAAPYALAVHENPRAGKTGGFSAAAIKGLEAAAGVSPRGGLAFGGRYRTYSQVGQWKYLETPLLAAQDKIRRVIEAAPGQAFERG